MQFGGQRARSVRAAPPLNEHGAAIRAELANGAPLAEPFAAVAAESAEASLCCFRRHLVGSYPQPEWLIDRKKLAGRFPPRVRARELWRVPEAFLAEAQEDATIMAIKAQEERGPRHHHRRRDPARELFQPLCHRARGVDLDNPGTALDRSGHPNPVPRVVGPIRRRHPVEVEDLEFLRRHTQRRVKVTVPGPFTMAQQAQIDFYGGSRQLAAMDYAAAVNAEIRDLFAAGADIVQIDEPYMQARPRRRASSAWQALNRALEGISGTTAVHICFGYAAIIHCGPRATRSCRSWPSAAAVRCRSRPRSRSLDCAVLETLPGKKIILGVIDLSTQRGRDRRNWSPARIRRALPFVNAADIIVAPDCGMKYLPREVAFGKLQAMVAGAQIVRSQLEREQADGAGARRQSQ